MIENKICEECLSNNHLATPLHNPKECLMNHTQYICGSCGRCICIEHDAQRNLQRWNYPFKSLEEAKLYLRTADYTMKKSCGIYEINDNKRVFYKIFIDRLSLEEYLLKNKQRTCNTKKPIYIRKEYLEYPNTEVRRLTEKEANEYLLKRK